MSPRYREGQRVRHHHGYRLGTVERVVTDPQPALRDYLAGQGEYLPFRERPGYLVRWDGGKRGEWSVERYIGAEG
jgi:hypothetical protein